MDWDWIVVILGLIGLVVVVATLLLFIIVLGTLLGYLTGWCVAAIGFDIYVLSVLEAFGIVGIGTPELGALLGFIGSFFSGAKIINSDTLKKGD
jgi:hypothetical protein